MMLLLAIAIVVYPLLRVRESSRIAYKDSNLSIHADKLKELELDLEEGRIELEHYKTARNELDRELLTDVPEESVENASEHYTNQARRQPALAILITVFIPLVSFLVYLELGMHAASTEEFMAQQQRPAATTQAAQMSVPEMAEKLLKHVQENGGGVQEWSMLGRSYKFMNRYEDASLAFAEALELDGTNAGLMLERAEVIALLNNRQFVPEARELVMKALTIEPDDANVLWFAGVAEYQAGNYRHAIDLLGRLAKTEAINDASVKQSVLSFISQAREKLVASGEMAADEKVPELDALLALESEETPVVAGVQAAAVESKAEKPAAGEGAVIMVQVDISEDVKQRFNGSADVFVYAKAKNGPRFPLAVKRMKLVQFPATVMLDDSMAMIEGMNLSAFGHVIVSARVTTSGSAIAQAGDYIGTTEVADVASTGKIKVTVSEAIN